MRSKKKEFSKVLTACVMPVLLILAIFFVGFVCYEMHRLEDLSPVEHMAGPILGIPAAVVAVYMWRAKAKSKTDLEWEQTKQLTLFREKHPEAFTKATIHEESYQYEDTETGGSG